MKSPRPTPALFFLLLCLPGCSSITLLRVQELKAVQAHIDSLNTQITDRIDSMQTKQSELLRVIRADMQARFSEIDKRLAALEGVLSESQDRLSQIDQKTAEIRRIAEEKARADSINAAQGTAAENLFKIAYSDFIAGRFDLALAGFTDLMKQFPQSTMAEEASYWTAECYYAQKDYANAETGFFGLIKTYPASKRLCASLYKLGLIYEAQKKVKSQKMVWDKLIAQCPESGEAQAAKGRLQ